ncbi:aldo/keto reductase [Campylobacter sp. 9BO]|uniref:aldo/keto reductase n=1 Tax=Campylobacter sp. 9BO TaxID=3424759 RepID=UPI003D346AEB
MKFLTLNDGNKMPILGFGVFQIQPNDTQRCVEDAISVGYRSIDTAQAYFNEKEVGDALKTAINGGIKRDEFFITTKLWINNMDNASKILKSIDESMNKLGVSYLDLLLIHQPYNDIYTAWQAMKRLKDEGMIRSIGVSNFYSDRVVDLCENTGVIPAVNQLECHPFYQREALKNTLDSYDIKFMSWASFAEGKNDMFNNETLSNIAQKHEKSVAQVILRWLIQRDIIIIPKSVRIERMKENFNVFDFSLDGQDIAKITKLDKDETLFFNHDNADKAKWIINIWKDKFK